MYFQKEANVEKDVVNLFQINFIMQNNVSY